MGVRFPLLRWRGVYDVVSMPTYYKETGVRSSAPVDCGDLACQDAICFLRLIHIDIAVDGADFLSSWDATTNPGGARGELVVGSEDRPVKGVLKGHGAIDCSDGLAIKEDIGQWWTNSIHVYSVSVFLSVIYKIAQETAIFVISPGSRNVSLVGLLQESRVFLVSDRPRLCLECLNINLAFGLLIIPAKIAIRPIVVFGIVHSYSNLGRWHINPLIRDRIFPSLCSKCLKVGSISRRWYRLIALEEHVQQGLQVHDYGQ